MTKENASKTAASAAPVELVVMVAKDSVKYGGKRHMPGDPLFAVPDDVEQLIADGLAEVADIPAAEPQQ